jgi:hypothetical protein
VVAGAGAIGLGDLLRLQARAADSKPSRPDTAVIQIWLGGGPSQFETYDPKPRAPVEIRGCYNDIATNLPGLRICETLPRQAQIMDKVAILRTVTHPTDNHLHGTHLCVTGHYVTNDRELVYPATGSLVAKLQGPKRTDMPPYVQLRGFEDANLEIQVMHDSGYLGAAFNPFTIKTDPNGPSFQIGNLELANDVTLSRMTDRRWLLTRLDNLRREIDAQGMMAGMDHFNQMALGMVTGGAARAAFDLSQEPTELRDRYGRHRWGQSALLARRLVEAGVPYVTINTAPDSKLWDWHLNLKDDTPQRSEHLGPPRGMDVSGPPLDQMVTALVEDLYDRGLDKKVLVLVWGEFGRTPRINKTGGRDHWGSLMSILLAGGGLRMGQVIGASNSKGEVPIDRPISPGDVLATVNRHLGLDPHAYTVNNAGRPIPVLPEGTPIAELI